MDKSNHDQVDSDIKKLADCLRGNIKTLCPLSEDCCIYRVPPNIRMLNESLYTPKLVSIGPLHHGRAELKAMEEHKLRYLQQFLSRTSVSVEDLLRFIKSKETNLRNCYAETIKLESNDFAKMILLDAVFLIEILLGYNRVFVSVDRIFTRPKLIREMIFDLMLLENQLPLFILGDLYMLADPAMPERYMGYSLSWFTRESFKIVCHDLLIDPSLMEMYFCEAKHFVDLLRLCLRPVPRHDDTKREANSDAAPNVTRLYQSGMKFELATTAKNLFDIRFNKGTLEMPKLTIGIMTVHLFRNIQLFEALHCDTNYMNNYVLILNRLLCTPKDVELLTHVGVIQNRIMDSEGVSSFFRELRRDMTLNYTDFYYASVVKDLQDYCKSPYHKWKANLKQNYFNTPWASLSVIAAVSILILGFIQAVCSIIGP